MSQWWLVGVALLFFSLPTEGALLINGTDCTGHPRVVNATMREVVCPPAENTVQVPVVEAAWEIQLLNVGDTRVTGCEKVVLFQNQTVLYYERSGISHDQMNYAKMLVNTSMSEAECHDSYKTAYNTTRSSDCCRRRYHHLLAVNKDHGSLILYDHELAKLLKAKHRLLHKHATCSVTGSEGRTASSSFTITTQNEKPYAQPWYSKASPVLLADSVTRQRVMWHVGSSDILCVIVTGAREIRSQWSYNGSDLDITEVSIATEDCVDCRREECIQEAESMAGLNSTHPPVAIVGKWESPCYGVAPSTVSFMSFVRVANATFGDSGDYVVKFKRNLVEFSSSYQVKVDWLRETSFVEEPSRELTVREGDTLQVPCIINTAVDTNLSQVYWSGPRGLITGISSMNVNNRPEMACQQNDIADRVFYVQMVTNTSSDAGTLAQVSLNLHVCNAEQQDSGVYRCGVWTGNGSGEFRSTYLTVESTLDDHAVAVAALGVVAFVLLVMLAVLVILLCCCVCQRYERVQHFMYRMHLQPMPRTNKSPGSLLPHAQTHV